MSTATRKTKRTIVEAIMDLMADYQPRTSEMIAELTGYHHGSVRASLTRDFCYRTERRRTNGKMKIWYSLRKRTVAR